MNHVSLFREVKITRDYNIVFLPLYKLNSQTYQVALLKTIYLKKLINFLKKTLSISECLNKEILTNKLESMK